VLRRVDFVTVATQLSAKHTTQVRLVVNDQHLLAYEEHSDPPLSYHKARLLAAAGPGPQVARQYFRTIEQECFCSARCAGSQNVPGCQPRCGESSPQAVVLLER